MASLNLFGRRVPLPKSRPARIALGTGLCLGGLAGFLPILGFWMLPLGVGVLAVDVPPVRRFRDRVADWFERRRSRRRAPARLLPKKD